MRKFGFSMMLICALVAGAIAIDTARASDEITINAYLAVRNGAFSLTRSVQGYRTDQTGDTMSYGVVAVSTDTNLLGISSDVTTAGYSYWRNVGTSTITIAVGSGASSTAFMVLYTNDVSIMRVSTTNLSAYTTTGNGRLEFWINQE